MVNESQRRGGHTPQGRVTAVSQQVSWAPVSSLPSVNNPSAFQGYFQHASPSYEEERQRWSTSAYKPAPVSRVGYGQIPMRAQTRDQVRIVLQVCYLLLSGKSEKTSIREGMPVDYEILPFALSEFIKVTLLPPLSKLIPGFSWDFSPMVVRETSSWQDILKMDPSVPYFQGRFLKVKTGAKSDGSRVFSAPKNPIEFSLIVNRDQWLQAEEYQENQNSGYQVHSMRSATPESVPKRKTPPSPEKIRPSAPSVAKRPNVSSSRSSGILSIAASDKEGKKPAFKSLNPDQVRQGILLGGQNAIMERKKNFSRILILRQRRYYRQGNLQDCQFCDFGMAFYLSLSGTWCGQTFVKYIHNADAVPLQDADEPGYEIGVFLCFIQHVQFVHTHGQAYMSDFQGAGDFFLDLQ
ncbi:hypothetical protein GALMADRAFT_138645 [Galerina marginata CBS 339.88]|uniref:Alpha-type protein kinase domain-containing protein n=1 Tax=Galerina marginata (strain CBS 339.88) TaxID=685588 RepID=A0A067TCE3_GALM3|nr:hypothetical protein GALMADRAFT_138645 [Galerina marginata CBS 339.88]